MILANFDGENVILGVIVGLDPLFNSYYLHIMPKIKYGKHVNHKLLLLLVITYSMYN